MMTIKDVGKESAKDIHSDCNDDVNIEESQLVKSIQEKHSPTNQIMEQCQEYEEYYQSLGPE